MNEMNICQSCGMPIETDVMKAREQLREFIPSLKRGQ